MDEDFTNTFRSYFNIALNSLDLYRDGELVTSIPGEKVIDMQFSADNPEFYTHSNLDTINLDPSQYTVEEANHDIAGCRGLLS